MHIVMFLFIVYGTYDFVSDICHPARGTTAEPVDAPVRSRTAPNTFIDTPELI